MRRRGLLGNELHERANSDNCYCLNGSAQGISPRRFPSVNSNCKRRQAPTESPASRNPIPGSKWRSSEIYSFLPLPNR
jgi:hypothetical protein